MDFSIKFHPFCEAVAKLVDRFLDPAMGVDGVKKNLKGGLIAFYGVYGNGKLVGFLLIRIDKHYSGVEEMVVMYSYAFFKTDPPFYNFLGPLYDEIANGRRIRIHSERRAIDRVLERHGFKHAESVFIKEPS